MCSPDAERHLVVMEPDQVRRLAAGVGASWPPAAPCYACCDAPAAGLLAHTPDRLPHSSVQCQYLIELYVPQLCGLEGMGVAPPPGGWAPHGGGEVAAHPHDATAHGAAALEGGDDPYLDHIPVVPGDDPDDPYE